MVKIYEVLIRYQNPVTVMISFVLTYELFMNLRTAVQAHGKALFYNYYQNDCSLVELASVLLNVTISVITKAM